VISGTVDPAATTQTFTVTATDANGVAASQSLAITVQPLPTITNVALNNVTNGNKVASIEQGDQIVVTFSQQMKVASFCSVWSNDATNQTLNDGTVTVTHGTHDVVTVASGSCTLNFGAIDLGSNGYVTGNITFGGGTPSTIAWNAAAQVLTITLGKNSNNNAQTNVAASRPVYTTSGSITDSNGVAISNSPFTLPLGQQF
jgi:hypothetical protein